MTDNTSKPYLWPDLSPTVRQYIVIDEQGRVGIANNTPAYNSPHVLFARPVGTDAEIEQNDAIYMTMTAWHKQDDGSYSGKWFDSPYGQWRRITILHDMGWFMPDKWADAALSGSGERGHWAFGATLGKIDGNPPVKGQSADEMTVDSAVSYASETGERISARGIRLAAKNGYIPGARKIGRDWLIPYDGFNAYLDDRPRPGRKGR